MHSKNLWRRKCFVRIIKIVNDFKIRNKLSIIYFFCVLIPVIMTNYVILSSIKENAMKQQSISIQNMMGRIKTNIQVKIGGCLAVTNRLCTDQELNEFLVQDYTSDLDYFNTYRNMLQNNVLRYYYDTQYINQIIIYANNSTILNGGNIMKMDSITSTEWYKRFVHSRRDTCLVSYYDEGKKYLGIQSTPRTISIIKELNYYGMRKMEKLVKIDLQYNAMLSEILNEKVNGEIYICNNEYILFSNRNAENGRVPFKSITELERKRDMYQDTFKVVSDEWTIYFMPHEGDIQNILSTSNKRVWWLIWINLLLPTVIIGIISESFTKRIKLMESCFEKVKQEEFEVIDGNVGRDEIGNLIKSYNVMSMRIKELIEVVFKKNTEKQALELARKDAELKALQSQVNPHFMFNTLESIRMRSLLKNENETADIIAALSQILRKSLTWKNEYICIDEEILFVKQYGNIQKYRFGDKIVFSYYVMEGCEKIKIPKLCILTFVENACIHGMEEVTESGVVSVAITKDEKYLFIESSDSGSGIPEEKLKYLRELLENPDINRLNGCKNVGMLNALIRMNLYYDNSVLFEINSEVSQGTDIIIKIPLEKIKGEDKDD